MATAMVIGAQWGDEGKGKIVDYLAAKADVVVRSQGGNNAGDRKSTRLNSSHPNPSRMPSSA